MSRSTLTTRLGRLEQSRGADDLSLSSRRWLGYPLTPEEHARADIEDVERKTRPPVDMSKFSPESQAWLLRSEVKS